jgi:hypothetical protein
MSRLAACNRLATLDFGLCLDFFQMPYRGLQVQRQNYGIVIQAKPSRRPPTAT